MTTFAEAKICPKCDFPGQDVNTRQTLSLGVTVHTIFCRQKGCEWYNTSWIVQINKDGTVPEAYEQLGGKMYPKLSAEMTTKIQENIDAQLRAETKPGTEIRNPHG